MEILVTAASKHGATAELATWLAEDLRADGIEATLLPPEAVASIARFGAVVLGSGVYAGHWLDEAKRFARRYSSELQAVPVWIFSSGPIGEPLKPDEIPVDVAEMQTLTNAGRAPDLPGPHRQDAPGLRRAGDPRRAASPRRAISEAATRSRPGRRRSPRRSGRRRRRSRPPG